MHKALRTSTGTALLVMGIVVGCAPALMNETTSRLPTVASMPDMLGLNVVFVERPLGDPLLGPELWESVDEQFLDPSVQQALEENGIRVGILGGQMPPPLETLLQLDRQKDSEQQPLTEGAAEEPTPMELVQLARRTTENFNGGPWSRFLYLRKGMPNKIVAGGPYPDCFVFMAGEGVSAQSFFDARFILQTTPATVTAHHAVLEFRPEVHHGFSRPQLQSLMAGGTPLGQEVETFPAMNWTASLTPGQIVLLTMWPQREGSLGWHFFSQPGGEEVKQRLIVIRVAHLPSHSNLYEAEVP